MSNFYLGEMLDKQKPHVEDNSETDGTGVGEPYMRGNLAVIPIVGPISRYPSYWSLISTDTILARIRKSEEKGHDILLHIDSPGGSASALFELTDYIRNSKVKITSYVGDLAASAGYLIASATSHITASSAAYVGSVGAIIQMMKGMDEEIKTYTSAISPMKYLPEGKARDAEIQKQVDRLGEMFVDDLVVNMGISKEGILSTFGRGALVPSEEAIQIGMIHSIGSFESLFPNDEGVLRMNEIETLRAEMKAREITMQAEFTAQQEVLKSSFQAEKDSASSKLTAQIATAKAEAIADEAKRITGIEALCITGHDTLVSEMKADSTVSVEMAAVRILTAERTSQTAAAANLKTDAANPLPTIDPNAVRGDVQLLAEFGGDQKLVDEYLAASKAGNVIFKGAK